MMMKMSFKCNDNDNDADINDVYHVGGDDDGYDDVDDSDNGSDHDEGGGNDI